MYSRQQLESDIAQLDSQRHDVRTALVMGLISGIKAKVLLDALDRQQTLCENKLAGVRLALQDRDLMKKRYKAVFVVCGKRWVRQAGGAWIETSLKECMSLAQAGNLIVLLVPFKQLAWYQQRFSSLGFKIQVKRSRQRDDQEQEANDTQPNVELQHDPVSRRTLQLVPVEVARELAERERQLVLKALADKTRCPETTEIVWAPEGNLEVAGLVVWQEGA